LVSHISVRDFIFADTLKGRKKATRFSKFLSLSFISFLLLFKHMGAADSKLAFRKGVFRLYEEKASIPT
jgi:hypothetical protein